MDYVGALRLDDEPPLQATIRLADDGVTLLADAEPIGRWALSECRIIPYGDGFRLRIGVDEAIFTPVEAGDLEDEIARRWPPVAAASAPLPGEQDGLWKWAAGGVAAILLAIVVAGLLARDRPTPGLLASAPTTVPPVPALFGGGVDQIPHLWNEAAGNLNLELFLLGRPGPNRLQMNLAPGLWIYATEAPPNGAVRSLMIAAAPTTSNEDGDAVLASWGILIATVNPDLDGLGRRRVLADLGVDPDRPLDAGLDTQTSFGGATYRLRSGVLGGKALLSVVPTPTG